MSKEQLKSMLKELFESGEIKVKIEEDLHPYISEGLSVSVMIDDEVVSKSYVDLKDISQEY